MLRNLGFRDFLQVLLKKMTGIGVVETLVSRTVWKFTISCP